MNADNFTAYIDTHSTTSCVCRGRTTMDAASCAAMLNTLVLLANSASFFAVGPLLDEVGGRVVGAGRDGAEANFGGHFLSESFTRTDPSTTLLSSPSVLASNLLRDTLEEDNPGPTWSLISLAEEPVFILYCTACDAVSLVD